MAMSERSGENAASGVATSEGKGFEQQEDADNTSERTTLPRMQEVRSSEDAGGGMGGKGGGEDAEGSDDCELAEDDGAAGSLEPKAQLMDVRKYDNDYSHFEQMDFSDDSEDERVREQAARRLQSDMESEERAAANLNNPYGYEEGNMYDYNAEGEAEEEEEEEEEEEVEEADLATLRQAWAATAEDDTNAGDANTATGATAAPATSATSASPKRCSHCRAEGAKKRCGRCKMAYVRE